MEFGLCREALAIDSDLFFRIEHNLHLLRCRIELNQVGVVSILGRTNVNSPIEPFDNRKVAALLTSRFVRDRIRF